MCSISGFIQLTKAEHGGEALKPSVTRMNLALRHRGPDDSDVVEISNQGSFNLCLGNTRLAILDTSKAGHQPMQDSDSGNWITYNGETYNFRQLRSEIGNEFGPWVSNTDTEVVLRAYRKWGVEAFGKLRGMFALAIWDNHKQQLLLARDRFGIKPLYYYFDPSMNDGEDGFTRSLLFASELRALLASDVVPRKLSVEGVNSFLNFGSVQAPLTIVENVRLLMPGQCLILRKTPAGFKYDFSRFVKPLHVQRPQSRLQAKAELRSILEESVQQHLVSDVPLGVFLSGGMDSSAIVALMSRVSNDRPKTFSVVFNEQQFSEANHSRLVAEKFQTDHREVNLTEESLLNSLPHAIAALDQPTMDGINTYVVSKAVREAGVTVALSGLGGDELFGGYPSFRRALRLRSATSIAKGALRAVAPIGQLALNGSIQRNKFWQLASSAGEPADVYRITRQLFSPDAVRRLSKSSFENGSEARHVSNGTPDTVNEISKLEIQGYMANTLLRDTDSMSMAHSLEVRVPFVDSQVYDFVLQLPGEWKLNGQTGNVPKPLLADAIGDLLPREFLSRKKMGFTLPFEKWMVGRLKDEISTVLSNRSLVTNSGVDQVAAERLWLRFISKPKTIGWSRPWSLYVLAKWCELNRVAV